MLALVGHSCHLLSGHGGSDVCVGVLNGAPLADTRGAGGLVEVRRGSEPDRANKLCGCKSVKDPRLIPQELTPCSRLGR